jgi:hypothetical protein
LGEVIEAAELAGGMATGIGVIGRWPQLRRLLLTRDVAGLSLASATIGASTESGWTYYLVRSELWIGAVASSLLVLINVLVAVITARAGARAGPGLTSAGAWGVALAALAGVGGVPVLGLVLGLSFAVQMAPAVWSAYRTPLPTGLAAGSWLLLCCESALWGVYGLHHTDFALTAFSVVGLSASAAILARMASTGVWRLTGGAVLGGSVVGDGQRDQSPSWSPATPNQNRARAQS